MEALGHFRCRICDDHWVESVPPLWSGYDLWPQCCSVHALFVELVS